MEGDTTKRRHFAMKRSCLRVFFFGKSPISFVVVETLNGTSLGLQFASLLHIMGTSQVKTYLDVLDCFRLLTSFLFPCSSLLAAVFLGQSVTSISVQVCIMLDNRLAM